MAVACGRGGEKVTSISSFKCGLFFWRWCPWRKMYLESVRLRLPGRYVAWRWQKDGSYQQDEAPFCSVPDSQVNNCRTSWQTKELAQLMTQGRWESCQHKTTREWSCLSGSCSPERRAGGGGWCVCVLSSLLGLARIPCKSITAPTAVGSRSHPQKGRCGLPVSEEKWVFNSSGENVAFSRWLGVGPHPVGSRIAWWCLWLPGRAV